MLYEDFDLLIERAGDGYHARVTRSPGGEAGITFKNPFENDELAQWLDLLARPGQSAQANEDASRDFGGRLFRTVFSGGVNVCLQVSLREVGEERGLRIRLHLSDVPELAILPWEYLYDPDLGSLSRSSRTPVVRYMDLSRPNRVLAIKLPLRVLVMISSPDDYPALDVKKEWNKLNRALKELIGERLVELVPLEKATISSLLHQFRSDPPYHVFHFIGHGGYDSETGDGFLILEESAEDEEGIGSKEIRNVSSRRVNGERVADLLRNHTSLRLAVINACDGARASLTDPFGGTAQSLVRASIPAVVAMQFPITDDAAITFAAEFYRAMADYRPVDAALADARNMMNETEWGTPALYMRSPDGYIFRKEPLPPPPPPDYFLRRAPDEVPDESDGAEEGDAVGDPQEIHYQMMIEALIKGELVPFLGPGANLCRPQGTDWEEVPYAPSDGELANFLSKSLSRKNQALNRKELVQVSQSIELVSASYLSQRLHDVLTRNFHPTRLHEFLATIPGTLERTVETPRYPLIVTSNYDDVLERAFDERKVEYDLISYIATGKHRGKFSHKPPGGEATPIKQPNQYHALSLAERAVILKIHGAVDRVDAQRDSYVITEDHYIDYLTRKNFFDLVPANLGAKLLDGKLLFLGYKLHGWNLRIILRRIWGEERLRSDSNWAIEQDSDPNEHKFWNKRNVMVFKMSLQEYIAEMEMRFNAVASVRD
jgi:hypothetical protein